MASPTIAHHPEKPASRGTFDLKADGESVGHLSYTLPDATTMNVDYVEVARALRGQGMGERLVGAAVAWARKNKRQIVPRCSYARAVMARTDAYQDVMKK